MKTLIVVRGAMGVGKTELCKTLSKTLNNSFWLDGDWCWTMNPWTFSEENKTMVLSNIRHLLRSFLENSSSQFILFSWVLHDMAILDNILDSLTDEPYSLRVLTLTCSKEALTSRLQKRGREDLIEKGLQYLSLYSEQEQDVLTLDTTKLTPAEIQEKILATI